MQLTLRPKRSTRRMVFAVLLACVLVILAIALLYIPRLFRKRHPPRHRLGEDELALPDPSGLASWKLRPDRARMRLKASTLTANADRKRLTKVMTPYVHSKTGKRTFGCLRTECRGLAMEDLTDRKWRMLYKTGAAANNLYKVSLLLTDGTEMTKLEKSRPEVFNSIQHEQEGKTYVECLEGADAIGGNKGQQLRTKERFLQRMASLRNSNTNNNSKKKKKKARPTNATALRLNNKEDDDDNDDDNDDASENDDSTSDRSHQTRLPPECTYDSLGIQPAQHRLYYKDECSAFMRKVESKYTFILKPETGSQGQGITFHSSTSSVAKKVPQFFPCTDNVSINAVDRFLVQEYIARPLLIKGCKFDARVYLLIASTDPWMVFYREGYLRRSLHKYNPNAKDRAVYLTNTHYQSLKEGFKLSDHIWTFERMQDYLTRTGATGSRYVDSILTPYIKKVANFVFQSAKSKLKRRKGSFHIFGLDFMIDDRFRVHFIEANGYPGFTWSINYDTRGLVTDIMDLVLELHEAPSAFERMRAGDNYGGFQMIFSEIEQLETNLAYDPCFDFYNNPRSFEVLRGALRRFSKFTGYAASRIAAKSSSDDDDDDDHDDGPCKSKVCKAQRKQQARDAGKARAVVDRMFENLADEVDGSVHIGGAKSVQLQTVAEYVSQFSCSWNELGVQPQSYRWSDPVECSRVQKFRTASAWIAKPDEHTGNAGSGFRMIEDQSKIQDVLGPCGSTSIRYVVQRRVQDILIVDGTQWSLRAYMLIASTKPFFVFYSPGFARSVRFMQEDVVVLGEREMSLEDYQYYLSREGLAGSQFVQTHVETFMKRVCEVLFRAARPKLSAKAKTHQLLELDFVVDSNLRVWFLAANAAPAFSKKLDVRDNRRGDMRALVLELADTAEAFAGMRYGDAYGPYFSLVYSEFDDYIGNVSYNPCAVFKKKWSLPLSVAKHAAELHDVAGRSRAANERELRKYTTGKWQQCRQKGNAAATCAQSTRRFMAERYRIFLEKERAPEEQRADALVEEWVDEKIASFLNPGAGQLEAASQQPAT